MTKQNTVEDLLSYFPGDWVSNVQTTPDEFGETGFNVRHPSSLDFELSVVVTMTQIGIAVLKDSESDVELDLGGFDYTFGIDPKSSWKQFFEHFAATGELK